MVVADRLSRKSKEKSNVSDVPVARLPDEVMGMVFSILHTKDINNVEIITREAHSDWKIQG